MQEELDKFSTVQGDKRYLNEQVPLQEGEEFIQNLRNTQALNNAEINLDTTNLGTYPAPQSNLGGLGGSQSYFERSYQTAPSISLASELRSRNQLRALETALKNDMDFWSNEYDKAYKAKRQRDLARLTNPTTNDPSGTGDLTINTNTGEFTGDLNPAKNKGAGYLNMDDRGTYYLSADGKKRYNLRDWTQTDTDFGIGNMYIKPKNVGSGGVVTGQSNKVQYLYYPGAQSQGGGDYYPITSIEDL